MYLVYIQLNRCRDTLVFILSVKVKHLVPISITIFPGGHHCTTLLSAEQEQITNLLWSLANVKSCSSVTKSHTTTTKSIPAVPWTIFVYCLSRIAGRINIQQYSLTQNLRQDTLELAASFCCWSSMSVCTNRKYWRFSVWTSLFNLSWLPCSAIKAGFYSMHISVWEWKTAISNINSVCKQ